MTARPPTIAEVARLAGVSSATVSLVLNKVETARISPQTRHRVLEAAERLHYRVNANAKALRIQRSHTIGLLSDRVATEPYAGAMVSGAQAELWRHGYLLFVIDTGADPDMEAAAVDALLERQVEGILFAAMSTAQVQPPRGLGRVRAVLLNCYSDGPAHPSVIPGERAGGDAATTLLLQAGHRRVAFINARPTLFASAERLKGYRDALARCGVDEDPAYLRYGDWRQSGGYTQARELLALPDPPTGILCANDRTAMGAYDAIREAGLRIPEDISVVGYDDQRDLADELHPPLTTVALPHREMGLQAARLLLSRGSEGVHEVTCKPVLRASVAAPPC